MRPEAVIVLRVLAIIAMWYFGAPVWGLILGLLLIL